MMIDALNSVSKIWFDTLNSVSIKCVWDMCLFFWSCFAREENVWNEWNEWDEWVYICEKRSECEIASHFFVIKISNEVWRWNEWMKVNQFDFDFCEHCTAMCCEFWQFRQIWRLLQIFHEHFFVFQFLQIAAIFNAIDAWDLTFSDAERSMISFNMCCTNNCKSILIQSQKSFESWYKSKCETK